MLRNGEFRQRPRRRASHALVPGVLSVAVVVASATFGADSMDTVINGSQHPSITAALRRRRRFRRSRVASVWSGGTEQSLDDALAELALLRQENARLSAAAHQPPDLGRLMGQVRSPGTDRDGRDDCADEAAQMIVEGIVLRESLLEVCRELERSMAAVKARLSAMGAEVESLALMRSRHDDAAAAAPPVLQDVSAAPPARR